MRSEFDFYPTPKWATEKLLEYISPEGVILEACAGKGDITGVVENKVGLHSQTSIFENDYDKRFKSHFNEDVAIEANWAKLPQIDWVITNPPFSQAPAIVQNAHKFSRLGVAMLLRLTFLEPCANRGEWLKQNPPSKVIVLPRISFTGDGKTDNVTCAWFVWEKNKKFQRIFVVPKGS